MAFKMRGMSFGNSPMKQTKKVAIQETKYGKVAVKEEEKFRLMSATRNDGTTEYFKVFGGSSTDGGKTFTPTVKTKISETEYNSYFTKKKKGQRFKEYKKKVQ